jgi:hypothetical protein
MLLPRMRSKANAMNCQQIVSPPEVQRGVYIHFKGGKYEVVGVARAVDSSDYFVIYRPLYGDKQLVARSCDDFMATVHIDNQELPRFRLVDPTVRPRKPRRVLLGRMLFWSKWLGRRFNPMRIQ